MEVLNIENYNEERFNTVVALGNFDGVHIGHKMLISQMVDKSKALGYKSSILLFNNHTKSILKSKQQELLTNNTQKIQIVNDLGVDLIYKIEFNEDIRKLTPEEFVKSILIKKLNCKAVVVGFDYKFGYKASGDVRDLEIYGKKYGFQVYIVEPVYSNDEIISSTKIRNYLRTGELPQVKQALGRNYSIIGRVVHGKNMGSKLGFPTANIELIDNHLIPKIGVYGTRIKVGKKIYLSATSIGYNSTFNESKISIECHIIDFNEVIYGEIIELEFLSYLRDEIKFNDLETLISQIDKDVEKIKSMY